IGEGPAAESLHGPWVLVERGPAAHGIAQPVGEGTDPRTTQLSLDRLGEARVAADLTEVPALAVQVDGLTVHAVLGEGELVQGLPNGEHIAHGMVAHQVEPETVHVIISRP